MFSWLKKVKNYLSETVAVVDSNTPRVVNAASDFKTTVENVDSFLASFRSRKTLGERIESLSGFIDSTTKPVKNFLDSLVDVANQKPNVLASVVLADKAIDHYLGENLGESNVSTRKNYSVIDQKISDTYASNYSGKFRSDINTFVTNIQSTNNSDYLQRLVNVISGDSKINKEGSSRRAWTWQDREKLLDSLVDEAPVNLSKGHEQIGILKKIVENNSYLKKTNLNAYKRINNMLDSLKAKYKT